MPQPIPVPVIDRSGITLPSFDAVHNYIRSVYREVYGVDIVITPDSQDGQLIGIDSRSRHDFVSAIEAAYNSFSPSTAQGVGLSRVVKINGIRRLTPSYSTVDVEIIGQAGSVINNGIVSDGSNRWLLPEQVVIPFSGLVTVSAQAERLGDITAPVGSINTIETPEKGWQQVFNRSPAVPGDHLETDAELRARQALSTSKPSRTTVDSILADIAELTGTRRYRAYENESDLAAADGRPPHSVTFVVEGGDSTEIANAIFNKKTPGVATFGTTVVPVLDSSGIPHKMRFSRPIGIPITYQVDIRRLPGYTADVANRIAASLSEWTETIGIGNDVIRGRAFVPANIYGDPVATRTFEISDVKIARGGSIPMDQDIDIRYYEVATSDPSYTTVKIIN